MLSNRFPANCVLLTAAFLLSSCSVYMASNQPDQKNAHLFQEGTSRAELLAEFGQPAFSEKRNGKPCDIFKFTQGYSKGSKVARAFGHGVADVLILGIWEAVGTPTETAFSGEPIAYEVCYDKEMRAAEVRQLSQKSGKE